MEQNKLKHKTDEKSEKVRKVSSTWCVYSVQRMVGRIFGTGKLGDWSVGNVPRSTRA